MLNCKEYTPKMYKQINKKIKIPKRPGEPDVTHANINLAKKELKWVATTSIEKGIGLTLFL